MPSVAAACSNEGWRATKPSTPATTGFDIINAVEANDAADFRTIVKRCACVHQSD